MSDIEDIIEEEMLEEQEKKEEKVLPKIDKKQKKQDEVEFVDKKIVETSSSYKDKLIKIYDELSHLKPEDLDEQIKEIKIELEKIIQELNESETRINKNVSNKIDKSMEEDKDLHYIKSSKANIISEAKEPIFTPTNILLSFLIVTFVVFGIIALAVFG